MIFFVFVVLFFVFVPLVYLFFGVRRSRLSIQVDSKSTKGYQFVKSSASSDSNEKYDVSRSLNFSKLADDKIIKQKIGDSIISIVVYWDAGESHLSPDIESKIDSSFNNLEIPSINKIRIIGKSDHTGNPSRNRKLSKERAVTVSKYIQSKYFKKQELIQIETMESIFGRDSKDRKQARSVQIVIEL